MVLRIQRMIAADELPTDKDERFRWLTDNFGEPKQVQTIQALRAMRLRDRIHPNDCVAWMYPDPYTFHAYSTANWYFRKMPTWGPLITNHGFLGVIDIRGHLKQATNPRHPDYYRPKGTGDGG